MKEGSNTQRTFVAVSTGAAYSSSKALQNIINDPTYIQRHIDSWKKILIENDSAALFIDPSTEQAVKIANTPVSVVSPGFMTEGIPDLDWRWKNG